MLTYNPKNRISCKDALNHPYFTKDLSFTEKYDQILSHITKDNKEIELHDYQTHSKNKLPVINDKIKAKHINADYYSKKNKLNEINYYEDLLK